ARLAGSWTSTSVSGFGHPLWHRGWPEWTWRLIWTSIPAVGNGGWPGHPSRCPQWRWDGCPRAPRAPWAMPEMDVQKHLPEAPASARAVQAAQRFGRFGPVAAGDLGLSRGNW